MLGQRRDRRISDAAINVLFQSDSTSVQMPNMIWLYRRPVLDYWAEHDETFGAIVAPVLVHEIGHHFGFSYQTTIWRRLSRPRGERASARANTAGDRVDPGNALRRSALGVGT
jgi:hypothetical protein